MTSEKPDREAVSKAAETLARSGWALAMLHKTYDDARSAGLPPHHAINQAIGKLATNAG